MPEKMIYSGTLAYGVGECYLDQTLMVIDDAGCADQDCTARRARDHFKNNNVPDGRRIQVYGFLQDDVLHIERD